MEGNHWNSYIHIQHQGPWNVECKQELIIFGESTPDTFAGKALCRILSGFGISKHPDLPNCKSWHSLHSFQLLEATLRSSGANLFLKFTAKARRPETSRSQVASRCSAFVCHGLRKAFSVWPGWVLPRLAVWLVESIFGSKEFRGFWKQTYAFHHIHWSDPRIMTSCKVHGVLIAFFDVIREDLRQ